MLHLSGFVPKRAIASAASALVSRAQRGEALAQRGGGAKLSGNSQESNPVDA
jgi:hypothetical protein